MKITLHCGGMAFDGTTVESKSLGGSESAAYFVSRELAAMGHDVTIFTNCQKPILVDGVQYVPSGQVAEQTPLGKDFHFYASSTPCDMLIIQRHPMAFAFKWASKVNVWWLHDLALKRTANHVAQMMHNITYVATVSNYHSQQVASVYGINPNSIKVVRNGVDLLPKTDRKLPRSTALDHVQSLINSGKKILTYSSRPERGLENLVKKDGIMDKLGDKYALCYCSYDNRPQHIAGYYDYLDGEARARGNCYNLGSLTKRDLAQLMQMSDLQVYPTDFEEVSCITAMECMRAGLPLLTTPTAALPETCRNSGTVFVDHIGQFADTITGLFADDSAKLRKFADQQRAATPPTWGQVASNFTDLFQSAASAYSDLAKAKHAVYLSDICMLKHKLDEGELDITAAEYARRQIETYYTLLLEGRNKEHYDNYYDNYEKARGVEYGPETLDGSSRYQATVELLGDAIAKFPETSKLAVVDYGCAHGHYTINLAKRFPDVEFIGVDVADSNVATARKWAADDGVSNVSFLIGDMHADAKPTQEAIRLLLADKGASLAAVLACEVLEHVCNPEKVIDALVEISGRATEFLLSTPYGPWEAIGYDTNELRAHMIHFEPIDLRHMCQAFANINVYTVPDGQDKYGTAIGSYITRFMVGNGGRAKPLNYGAKWRRIVPARQTVSACIIAKDCETTLGKCLNSIAPIVDEVIIGLDRTSTDDTCTVIKRFRDSHKWIDVKVIPECTSPLKIGFAEARNHVIKHATCEWICWVDTDEAVVGAPKLASYLRHNLIQGIHTQLAHYSASPIQVLKVDLPTKFYRHRAGIKFYGMVHEHPETEMNSGIKYSTVWADGSIQHFSYDDEGLRRGKFIRNLPLLQRDRKENPTRTLGKLLWLRDLGQMGMYERERGGQGGQHIMARLKEGTELMRDFIEDEKIHCRMVVDAARFYTLLVDTSGLPAVDCSLQFAVHSQGATDGTGDQPDQFKFCDTDLMKAFVARVIADKSKSVEGKYL